MVRHCGRRQEKHPEDARHKGPSLCFTHGTKSAKTQDGCVTVKSQRREVQMMFYISIFSSLARRPLSPHFVVPRSEYSKAPNHERSRNLTYRRVAYWGGPEQCDSDAQKEFGQNGVGREAVRKR